MADVKAGIKMLDEIIPLTPVKVSTGLVEYRYLREILVAMDTDKPSDVKTEQTLNDAVEKVLWDFEQDGIISCEEARRKIIKMVRSHKSTDKVEIDRGVAERWTKFYEIHNELQNDKRDVDLYNQLKQALNK